MRKQIILHIGHEKTGSTSIQNYLSLNRDKLSSIGVVYPKIGFQDEVHSSLISSLHELDNNCSLEFAPSGYSDPGVEWGKLIEYRDAGFEKMILSSEHFISRMGSRGIKFIRKFLAEEFSEYDVSIIAFLRRQDKCFISRVSTLVKAGATKPYSFWVNEVLEGGGFYDYHTLLEPWSEAFGRTNMLINEFDKNIDVINTFSEIAAIPKFATQDASRKNLSWDPITLEVGLKLNFLCQKMNAVERRKRLSLVNDFVVRNGINSGRISKNLISQSTARSILDRYSDSNSKLSFLYNKGVPIFQSTVESNEYGGELGMLSDDEVMKILFRVIGC